MMGGTTSKEGRFLRNVSAALICNHFTVVTPGSQVREVRPILWLTIVAVSGVLIVPKRSIFTSARSTTQNNTLLMTIPCLTCSSVSHCQENGQIQ